MFHFWPSRHLSLAFFATQSWQLIFMHWLSLMQTSGFTLTVLLSLINVYWWGSGQSEDDALCFLLLFLCFECFFTFFECFFASWHNHYTTWESHSRYWTSGAYDGDASSSCSSCDGGPRSGCSFARGLLCYERRYPCSGGSCVRNVLPYRKRSRFNFWMVIYRTLPCAFWHCPAVQLSSSFRTNLCCWACVDHWLLVYSYACVFSLLILDKREWVFVVIALFDHHRV